MVRLQLIAALVLALVLPVRAQHVRSGAGTSQVKADVSFTTSDTALGPPTTVQTPGVAWMQTVTSATAGANTSTALFRLLFQPAADDTTGVQRTAIYGYTETGGTHTIGSDTYGGRFRTMHLAAANFTPGRTARLYGTASSSYNGYLPTSSPGGVLGATHSQFGAYNTCFVQGSAANTASCTGTYSQGSFDLGTVGDLSGSINYALINGTAGPVGAAYGSQHHVLISANASLVVPQAFGVYADIAATNPVQFTTAYGFYAGSIQGVASAKYSFYASDATAPSAFLGGTQTPFVSTVAASSIIASATTIAPTNGVHHISGTTPIATITVPATCGPTCTLYLIPDAAFTTTTAGNIRIVSTAVAGRAMMMVWDGTKWNPSY